MELNERLIASEEKYKGKFISVRQDVVAMPDGSYSARDIVVHPGGVGVIAITENNELVMVRQFRSGPKEVLLEVPAGKLEFGEDPRECGLRELAEETGYTAKSFEKASEFYSTPGFTDEKLYLYVAKGLEKGELSPDEDEFIEAEAIPFEKLKQMAEQGEIKDGKTLVAIFLAEKYLY